MRAVGAPRGELDGAVLGLFQRAVAGERELHHGRVDGALGNLVERLQHVHRALRVFLVAFDLELLVPVRDLDVQRLLDAPQVPSSGPQRWLRRVLLGGAKVCRRITRISFQKRKGHP